MTNHDVDTPARTEIVAKAGTYYRVARYIITAVMIGMGLWFGYDGFIGWPEKNRKVAVLEEQRQAAEKAEDRERAAKLLEEINDLGGHKGPWDIGFQIFLFCTLPPAAIVLFIRWMYISRGAYRLTPERVLHVPGHPPVPLDSITEIDKRLWDRKGIVFISYELADGTRGALKLDDFIYEREPTDEIFKRVEEHVLPQAQESDQSPLPDSKHPLEQEQSAEN